jgi:hypothetical protein
MKPVKVEKSKVKKRNSPTKENNGDVLVLPNATIKATEIDDNDDYEQYI